MVGYACIDCTACSSTCINSNNSTADTNIYYDYIETTIIEEEKVLFILDKEERRKLKAIRNIKNKNTIKPLLNNLFMKVHFNRRILNPEKAIYIKRKRNRIWQINKTGIY